MLILHSINIALCVLTILAMQFNWQSRVFELIVDAYVFPAIFILVLASYPVRMRWVSFTTHTNGWMALLTITWLQGLVPFLFYRIILLLTTLL